MAPQPATQTHKSTGPRTPSGKFISSRNALRHGLASGTPLISGEDPAELAALELSLREQYRPANPIERLLVADMARHHWLKDRALRLQDEALALAQPGEIPASFPVLLRYQSTNERAFYKSLAVLQALQQQARDRHEQFVSLEAREQVFRKLFAPLPDLSQSPAMIAAKQKIQQLQRQQDNR